MRPVHLSHSARSERRDDLVRSEANTWAERHVLDRGGTSRGRGTSLDPWHGCEERRFPELTGGIVACEHGLHLSPQRHVVLACFSEKGFAAASIARARRMEYLGDLMPSFRGH